MFEHHLSLITFRSFVLAGCLAVLAGCGAGHGASDADKSPDAAMAPPADLAASAGNDEVTLTWNASSGATSYNVKRSTTSGGPYTQLAAPTSPGYVDASTSNGTAYYYVVTALTAAEESVDSAQVSATPEAPQTAPATPANLKATAGNVQVSLTWSASNGATSYNVKRGTTDGGPYTQLTAVTSPSYTDAAVSNGTAYFYVVNADNAVGMSSDSASVSATPDPAITTPAVPMAPAASAGNAKVSVTWSASSSATSYHVKRATTSGGPYTQIGAPTASNYTDVSLANGTKYFYVVSAVDSAGESANSAQVSATPAAPIMTPSAPTGLSAKSGNAQVTLAWAASSGGTSYHVKRATNSGGPYSQVAAPTSASYTDVSVTNGTKYFYVISALDSAGESANSQEVNATPTAPVVVPSAPTGLGASTGSAQVTLTWTGSSGATSYHVKRATTSGGSYTQVGAPTAASYIDSSLTNGTTYYYVVSAVDSAGESANSAQVSASPAATTSSGTPPNLTPGVWLNITPPAPGFGNTFGSASVTVSPVDPNVIYATVDTLGIWKSTDRGATWAVLGNGSAQYGQSSPYLDSAVRVLVDPADANHLYASQGVRGVTLGFWVSTDGGNTWTMPQGFADAAKSATNDVTTMVTDPTNFKHILLGSHGGWQTSNTGIMESVDGGQSWTLHPGSNWPTGTVGVAFLYDLASGQGNSNTWLVTTDGAGTWRTTNAGGSWTQVSSFNEPHGGTQIYYAKDGTVYSGAAGTPMRSHDNGLTWEAVSNGLANWYYYSIYGDGTTLYTQLSYTGTNGGQGLQPYMSASEATGGPFTPYQGGAQTFNDGPAMMQYDAVNGIMYSASWDTGVWALKVIKP